MKSGGGVGGWKKNLWVLSVKAQRSHTTGLWRLSFTVSMATGALRLVRGGSAVAQSFLSLTLPILRRSPADWQPWREGMEARCVWHCSSSTQTGCCLFFSSNRFLFEMMTSLGRHLIFEVSLPPCWTGCSFLAAFFFLFFLCFFLSSQQSLTSSVQWAQKSCLQP